MTLIQAQPILELRTALAQVYTAIGLSPPGYSTTPAPGALVRVADIAELRTAVVALE